jgi:hypothetical protein
MESTKLETASSPPSLMKSLMAGFDAISNHLGLVFFSVLLDILLWFGPHIRVLRLFEPLFDQAASFPEMEAVGTMEMIRLGAERLNLFSILRTFPIGVPSLLAGRAPIETPIDTPLTWDVSSLSTAVILWISFIVIGLGIGTLYFALVAQAIYAGKVNLREALSQWPWYFWQITLLTIFCYFLFSLFLLPVTCLLSMFLMLGVGLQAFPVLMALFLGGILIWFIIPLFFSPHGIFANRFTMWDSMIRGIQLSRSTFTSTGLLILLVVILSEGLRILWNIPADDSWLTLVGVIGHAFITAGLLAATFFYYREADLWLRKKQAEKLHASELNQA